MQLSKIVDASSIFMQQRQVGVVEELSTKVHAQETYNRKDLYTIIERVNNVDVKKLPKEDQYKFQKLCGRVHTLNVNHMVDAIYDEAHALFNGEYDSTEELASRTQTLKEMMADVWSNNSLSQKNSNFLRLASVKLAELSNQTPSSKINDMVHHSKVNFIEDDAMDIESEVVGAVVDPSWEEAELSIDILQAAQHLHQGHPEGVIKFRRLPQDIQEKLGPVQDSPEYIREMVTFGMGLVRRDGYAPSLKEVEQMFAEAPLET